MMSRRSLFRSGSLNNIFLIFILISLPFHNISAQIIINEIMAYNATGILNPDLGERTDWIEIHNTGTTPYDLTSCSLSDNPENLDKWIFPDATIIDPEAFLIIWADEAEDILGGFHTNFKLNVAGETVYLVDKNGILLDSLRFSRQFMNVSYGKTDTSYLAYFSLSTPGSANDMSSSYRIAAGIQYNPPPGIYQDYPLVELSWEDTTAVIRYTIDGSEPDENSTLYNGPLSIKNNVVIRTKIWADGYQPGWIETATYFISDTFTLPVFSLVTDPVNLWDDMTGIYTEGTNGITGYCSDVPLNWNQDWERPVSLEYFGKSGLRKLFTDGGIKIHGGCSRQAPMKSLAFFARNEYGNNELRYPFFRENDIDKYKDLIFRNSGNDFWYTMIRDGMIQAVAKKSMDIDAQGFEPVQVFLNGEYWGIHNLREDLNEHYFETHYGLPPEEIDLLKWDKYAISGDNVTYRNLENYMASHSLSPDENYNYVAERIDVNEYINYMIIEMFFANLDWPGNNIKYWRHRSEEGKWRWMLFDLDFTLGIYEFNPAFDMFTFTAEPNGPDWPNPPWSTFLYRKLLENQGFRDLFVQKFMMHLNTTLQPENVIQVIDSMYSMIAIDFPAHFARWNQPWSIEQWYSNIENLRIFTRQRPYHVWETMKNYFSLSPVIYLSVDHPDTAGTVMVNDFLVPPGGMNGRYISGMPLNIQAFPAPGNKFVRWDITPSEFIEKIFLARQSVWKYYDAGNVPGDDWFTPDFDDTSWTYGMGELGYGDGGETTVLNYGPDENNKYITYYFRKEIEIEDLHENIDAVIRLMRDDGVVVYINGNEVLRVNMPDGDITYETLATNYAGGSDESTYFEYTPDELFLQSGKNIIAVEIHQSGATSSDISFDMEITGSYFITGEPEPYEGSYLTLTPANGLSIHPVFSESEELPHIIINEFMATNQDAYEDEFGEDADWIELFNTMPFDVNIAGFYITDDFGEPFKWQIPFGFPEKTTIPAGGYMVLFADRDTLQGPLHLDIKLGAEGEEIGLSVITNNIFHWIDTVSFGSQMTNISYGRYPDGDPRWEYMAQFTPGASNLYTSAPVFSKKDFRLYVYPNPAEDITYVQITGMSDAPSADIEINLYDLTGRMIMNEVIPAWGTEYYGSIDLSNIPQGFYILKVRSGAEQLSTRLLRK